MRSQELQDGLVLYDLMNTENKLSRPRLCLDAERLDSFSAGTVIE
jgi:hypothetical protein